MKIRAIDLIASPYGVIHPGHEGKLPNEMAIPLVAGGHAVSLEPPDRKPVETATIGPAVKAVTRGSRKLKR